MPLKGRHRSLRSAVHKSLITGRVAAVYQLTAPRQSRPEDLVCPTTTALLPTDLRNLDHKRLPNDLSDAQKS